MPRGFFPEVMGNYYYITNINDLTCYQLRQPTFLNCTKRCFFYNNTLNKCNFFILLCFICILLQCKFPFCNPSKPRICVRSNGHQTIPWLVLLYSQLHHRLLWFKKARHKIPASSRRVQPLQFWLWKSSKLWKFRCR